MVEHDKPLQAFLNGSLKPQLALISDNVVQPALPLLREAIAGALRRPGTVCLLCTELPPTSLLDQVRSEDGQAELKIIDACDDEQAANAWQRSTQSVDVEDLDQMARIVQSCEEKTTLFIDSLNTLEAFSSSTTVYRFLKQASKQGIDIVAVHHSDVPSPPSASTSIELLLSLLSPTFSSSSLHLRLHSPAVLSHLHHAYSLEQVGQDPSRDIDHRVYEYLPLLYRRHWGSPLHVTDTEAQHTPESLLPSRDVDIDTADPRDVELNALSKEDPANSRCCVEFSMRGLGKANKRSEGAKMLKGLEGVHMQRTGSTSHLVVCKDVSYVLRIRSRSIGSARRSSETKADPDPTTLSTFNLGTTDKQREAKENAGLPYTPKDGGEIVYQPDSADDLDESDPDEDLDL